MFAQLKKLMNWNNTTFRFAIYIGLLLTISFVELLVFETTPGLRTAYVLNIITLIALIDGWYVMNFYLFKVPNLNYLNLFITGCIMYLVIHPDTPVWQMAVAVLGMLLGKLYIRYKSQPIFNPAALGILLGYLFSVLIKAATGTTQTLFESWWGTDVLYSFYKNMPVLQLFAYLLLALMIYFAWKFRKLTHAVTYLVTYLLCMFVMGQVTGHSAFVFSPTMLLEMSSLFFLTFVMVTEPKTSPILRNHQIGLGVFGGLALFVVSQWIPVYVPALSVEIPWVTALLILNLATFLTKQNFFMKKNVALTSSAPAASPPVSPTPAPSTAAPGVSETK